MVAICNVSLPSMGSSWNCDGSWRTPASLAMRFSSSAMADDMVRRSTTYFVRNASPSRRAISTLSTNRLAAAARFSSAASWLPNAACSTRRSAADPPNGLKATTAAARLAASNATMMARMATRGSLMDTPVSLSWPKLKLLAIIHRKAAAIEGIRLGRGLGLLLQHVTEQGRVLQRHQQFDLRFGGRRRHRHIQHHVVAGVQGGTDLHNLHVVGDGLLQVRENAGPANPFAVEERIDEDAKLQHLGVFRPGQHGGQLGLFGIGLADLPVEPGDILADAGLLRAVGQGQRNQRSQRGQQQQAANPLKRLAGEVDGDLHFNCSWRWTAGSPTARRYPLPAFQAATAQTPSPRPTLPRNAARPPDR